MNINFASLNGLICVTETIQLLNNKNVYILKTMEIDLHKGMTRSDNIYQMKSF